MSSDQMPTPGKTKLIKYPPSWARKDVKCPGGGDVEASIWLIHYVRCDRSVPYTCTFTAISTTLTDQNLKLMKQDRMVICRVFHWNVAYWPTVLKCTCLYFCSQSSFFVALLSLSHGFEFWKFLNSVWLKIPCLQMSEEKENIQIRFCHVIILH